MENLSKVSENMNGNNDTGDSLIQSFSLFIKNIEDETKTLKNISTLRQLVNNSDSTSSSSTVLENLRNFEQTILHLENSIDHFEEQIDNESLNLQLTKDLVGKSMIQQEEIAKLISLVQKKDQMVESSVQNNPTKHLWIDDQELQLVSKTTRGRLTSEQVSQALEVLSLYSKEKSKIFTMPRKQMTRAALHAVEIYTNLRLPEHGNSMLLTESEIRTTSVFQYGEATGKSLLHTLRALKKIKLIRSGNESTYILMI